MKIAFGLPKHSEPRDEIVEKRLQCQHLPLIASLGSSSIVVGNLPFNFNWSSSGEDAASKQTTNQILESLRPPKSSSADDLPKGSSVAAQGSTPSSNLPFMGAEL
jgi:hypothetical protein